MLGLIWFTSELVVSSSRGTAYSTQKYSSRLSIAFATGPIDNFSHVSLTDASWADPWLTTCTSSGVGSPERRGGLGLAVTVSR